MTRLVRALVLLEQDLKKDTNIKKEIEAKKAKIELDKRYANNPEDVQILQKIEQSNKKVRAALVKFLNVCIGVGADDKSLNNAGEPSKEEFLKIKTSTLSEINKLINNESRAPGRYYTMGKQIKKEVERIHYSELDFDEKGLPMDYSEIRKNADIGRFVEIDRDTLEIPAEYKKVMSAEGVAAKPMYNPDVFEDLMPLISALCAKRKSKILDSDSVKDAVDIIKKGTLADQMTRERAGYKSRREDMLKAIDNMEIDDDGKITNTSSYDEKRNREKNIAKINTAKNELKKKNWEENKVKDEFSNDSEKQAEKKDVSADDLFALPKKKDNGMSAYAAQREAGKNALYQGSREKNEVKTITLKETSSIINKWITEKAPKDKEHTIKLFGNFPGMGSAYGVLIFVPGKEASTPTAVKLDGEYGFKAHKTWYNNQLTAEQREYVVDNRKNKEWKNKVLEIWKTSVQTEEYFEY